MGRQHGNLKVKKVTEHMGGWVFVRVRLRTQEIESLLTPQRHPVGNPEKKIPITSSDDGGTRRPVVLACLYGTVVAARGES